MNIYVLSVDILAQARNSLHRRLSMTSSQKEMLNQLKKNQELSEVFIYQICVYALNLHLMKIRVSVDIDSIGILPVTPRRTSS